MGTAAWKYLPVLAAAVSAFDADSPEPCEQFAFLARKIARKRSNSTGNLFQNETCVCQTVLQKKRIRCVALK